jgi:hypothetical protein
MKFSFGRSVFLSGALAGVLALTTSAQTASPPAPEEKSAAEQKPAADVAKELDAMKARIGQLETELAKTKQQPGEAAPNKLPADLASTVPVLPPSLRTPDGKALVPRVPYADPPSPDPQAAASPQAPAAPAAPPPVDLDTPFAFADFTWMLSVPRNHDAVLDGKYFSGEFRVDTNYMYDYNHPGDHTLTETTEGERTG